jgi:hypothetical protein
MDHDARERLEGFRSRVRQFRRLQQILRRRRAYKQVSLARVAFLDDAAADFSVSEAAARATAGTQNGAAGADI